MLVHSKREGNHICRGIIGVFTAKLKKPHTTRVLEAVDGGIIDVIKMVVPFDSCMY